MLMGRGARLLAVSVALALVWSATPLRHTHGLGESDLVPHDHADGAVLVTSGERCGAEQHLHALKLHRHGACPACLAAAAGSVSVPKARLAVDGARASTPLLVARETPALSRPLGPSAGRAPPLVSELP